MSTYFNTNVLVILPSDCKSVHRLDHHANNPGTQNVCIHALWERRDYSYSYSQIVLEICSFGYLAPVAAVQIASWSVIKTACAHRFEQDEKTSRDPKHTHPRWTGSPRFVYIVLVQRGQKAHLLSTFGKVSYDAKNPYSIGKLQTAGFGRISWDATNDVKLIDRAKIRTFIET